MGRKNEKFRFNPEKLTYERVDHTLWSVIRGLLRNLAVGLIFGAAIFAVYYYFFNSHKGENLLKENQTMVGQYKLLNRQLKEMQDVINDLQERDNNLYRVIFQADPIPYSIRMGRTDNNNRYEELQNYPNSKIMVETTKNADALAHEIYLQSKSYDELVQMAINHDNKLKHIPAIQPIRNKDLKRMASGYGSRIDPVYHTMKFHEGMDFTANTGTEVFVTGDGRVTYAGWHQGYGNTVYVDHGYDYETRYAHLSVIKVYEGQLVKRGDVIALTGNTGKSTGPHLHYEVRYKGAPQNPANYYFMDLSPEEYDIMLQMSNNSGKVLD